MYNYTYRNSSIDLWQLSMYYIYGSMVGLCNVIFTVAVLALAVAKWETSGLVLRCACVLGCLIFTVFQPLTIYRKARKQAKAITEDTEISFHTGGVHVKVGKAVSDMKWSQIKRVSKKPTMIVVFTDTTHGYVLTNRVIGKDREQLYAYITSRMKRT